MLIWITLTWYQSWFYKTRLNFKHNFFFKWYLFSFCKSGILSFLQLLQIWYFIFPSVSVICYLFSFYNICSVSTIWYFVFRCFCIMVFFVCWLWLLKKMIRFSLWVCGWMKRIIHTRVMSWEIFLRGKRCEDMLVKLMWYLRILRRRRRML
jgi:hypothetical protein